jgi:hypothetical protein
MKGIALSFPPEHYQNRQLKLVGWLDFLTDQWVQLEATSLAHADNGVPGFAEAERRVYTCGHCGGHGCEHCRKGRVIVYERDPYAEPPETATGLKLDESNAARRARDSARIDRELERLRSLAAGEREDRYLKVSRLHDGITRRHPFLARLERALALGWGLNDLVERLSGPIPKPPRPYRRENPRRSKGANDRGKPNRTRTEAPPRRPHPLSGTAQDVVSPDDEARHRGGLH